MELKQAELNEVLKQQQNLQQVSSTLYVFQFFYVIIVLLQSIVIL